MDSKRFMTTADLAGVLGVSPVTVWKRIKAGEIAAQKIGGRYLISYADFTGFPIKITEKRKRLIQKAVQKTISEYGEVLKRLGND